jgi:hypothetical protein
MPTKLSRPLVPLLVCATVVAVLSGCTPSGSPSSPLTSGPTASSSDSGSSGTAAPASPTPSASPTPVAIGCDTLVSADVMYAFNPNYGLISNWTPSGGSDAAKAKAEQGIACRWQNQSSGTTIDISVAHLDSASIEALKNAAVTQSTMVPTYGDEAYFTTSAGTGTAIAFQGDYWLVATSVEFLEPGDPADLINAALGQLK